MINDMCSIIYQKLKEECKGLIRVQPMKKGSTTVLITITTDNTTYVTYVDDIIGKMYEGFNSDECTKDIITKYKYYLSTKYFY